MTDNQDEVKYGKLRVLVSAVVGVGVALLLTAWFTASGGVFYERLSRVGPTVAQEGIGSDWVAGNTIPVLDFAISLVHAADVIMGGFILVMVFIHWASFRRLADKMRDPDETVRGEGVATDGGPGETGAEAGASRGESR